MVEGELTVDCCFCLKQTQRIILRNLTGAISGGFAASAIGEVAFFDNMPNADIPILTAPNFIYRYAAVDFYF